MIKRVDVNCDMGEVLISSNENKDHLFMPYISSCNIATGAHAGDLETMVKTMYQAKSSGVSIGIHLSYADRKNFGRKSLTLTNEEFYGMIARQFEIFYTVADKLNFEVSHCKPHGALYHDLSLYPEKAEIFIGIIKSLGRDLTMYAMGDSFFANRLKIKDIAFRHEVFADRRYVDSTSLVPRCEEHSAIKTVRELSSHLDALIHNTLETKSGKVVSISVDTICVHSDSENALMLAEKLHCYLQSKNIEIVHH